MGSPDKFPSNDTKLVGVSLVLQNLAGEGGGGGRITSISYSAKVSILQVI